MSRLNLTVHADGIAVVTLTHPPVNALDAPLFEELAGLFEGLAAEPVGARRRHHRRRAAPSRPGSISSWCPSSTGSAGAVWSMR